MTTEEYLRARTMPGWQFNQIVPLDSFYHVGSIHPLKQKAVQEIVAAAKQDPFVRRIIVFGSATRYDCDLSSDLDLCIDWNAECYDDEGVLLPFTRSIRKTISQVTSGRADVLNGGEMHSAEIDDAIRKGVIVYEQHV